MGAAETPPGALLDGVRLASSADRHGRPLATAPAGDGEPQRLAQQALRWTHVVRSRQRWVHDATLREQLEASARESLATLGLSEADLKALAREPLLVVRMPFRHEAQGWEGRVLPWEYLLAAATRRHRRSPTGRPRPLTVIRELQVQHRGAEVEAWATRPQPRVTLPRPPRALFVAALPPALRAAWPVDGELAQFRRALPADVVDLRVLDHPSLDEFAQVLREFQPTLLHIAGVDAHQGLRELQRLAPAAASTPVSVLGSEPGAPARAWTLDALLADRHARVDGLLLRGPAGEPQLVPAQALARAAAQAVQAVQGARGRAAVPGHLQRVEQRRAPGAADGGRGRRAGGGGLSGCVRRCAGRVHARAAAAGPVRQRL